MTNTPKKRPSADAVRAPRRRLNLRLLSTTLVVTIVVAGGMYFLNAYQVKASARKMRDRAQTLREEGNNKQASQYMRQYVGFVPDDTDASIALAEMLEEPASDPRQRLELFQLYERILRQQPENHAIRRKLAELAMKFQRPDDARAHLKELLSANPNDGELEFLYGRCEELSGKPGAAAERYQAALRKGFRKVDVYLLHANLLRNHLKQPAEANALIDQMVQEAPQSYEALLVRAGYRKLYGSLAEAAEDASRAVELAPDKTEPIVMAAELVDANPAATSEQVQAARASIELAIAREPKNSRLYQTLAQLAIKAGKLEDAVAALRRGQEQLPDQPELSLRLADHLISANRASEADREIARLKELKIDNSWIEYLEARSMMQRGELLPASQRLQRIATQQGLNPFMRNMVRLQLGACYQRMGSFELQLAEFEAVLEADPLSILARRGAAEAHRSLGHTDAALAHFEQLMSVPKIPLQVGRLLYERNLRLPPERQDWKRIEQILNDAGKNPENAVEVGILRADVEQARGHNDEARATFEQLLRSHPEQAGLWVSQARQAMQQEDWDRALSILTEAENKLGDSVAIRLARSLYWGARGGADAGPALAKLAEGVEAFSRDDKVQLLDGLANVRLSLGQFADAKALWIKLVELQPDNVRAQFRLFSLALSLGDEATKAHVAAELRRLEGPEGPHVLTSDALVLIERAAAGDAAAGEQARLLLSRVASQRPGWPIVPMNQARLNEISGDVENALVNYRRAVDVGSREPAVLRRVASLLLAKNRFQDAEQFVQQIRDDTPPFLTKEIRRMVAEASLKALDFEQAQMMARDIVSTDSRDSLDQIWFGQMMAATGHIQEGQRALEKAVQIDPAKPGPWVSLVLFLARTNQVKAAEQAIEKARQSIPAETSALTLALCYEAVRRNDEAEKHYLAAASSKPNDEGPLQNLAAFYLRTGQSPKAEPILRKLIAPERKATPAAAAWARRTLAAAISPVDYPHYQEAVRLLDENKIQPVDPAADGRIRARLLLSRPSKENVSEALQLFQELETRGALMPADQFLMAQTCDASGRTEDGDAKWTALLATYNRNPLFVSAYISRQMRNQKFDDARTWLSKLQQLEPNSFVTVELAARMMMIDNKLADVLQMLTAYTNSDNPLVKEQKDRMRQVVGLLVALSSNQKLVDADRKQLTAETENWYRKLVKLAPDTTLAFAVFLGGEGRTQEALDLCERMLKAGQVFESTAACLPILRASDRDDKWFQRVQQWMEAAVKQHPDSLAGLIQLAELHDLRGHYKDAAKIDREVLKRSPRNVVALNNLAWLLAIDQNQPEEAVQLITLAIEAVGPLPTLVDTRGTVLLKKGETGKAIADFQNSLAQAEAPVTRYHLAEAYWKSKDNQQAKTNLDKAIAAGLKPEQLHPLERASFEAMLREFSGK